MGSALHSMRYATQAASILAAGVMCAACASAPSTAILSQPSDLLAQPVQLVAGGIQALGSVELPKVAASDPDPVGKPTELYARIARGATRCWFGGDGHLKATHIFNAFAEPETRGGNAEIVIHEISREAPDPRGNRAFRVSIVPEGDFAAVSVENSRFPLDEAANMEREVRRWARGEEACSPRAVATAAPGTPPETSSAKPPATKSETGKSPKPASVQKPASDPPAKVPAKALPPA
ncbi:MAG: hypothetical protein SH859_00185 [Hyphomicrobium aestuarii]|nr:hypothetical protein [Hyphomicrobium aestuarii]